MSLSKTQQRVLCWVAKVPGCRAPMSERTHVTLRSLVRLELIWLDRVPDGWALTPTGERWIRRYGPRLFDPGTGPMEGFYAGRCGHRVAITEWWAGFRHCERCQQTRWENGRGDE